MALLITTRMYENTESYEGNAWICEGMGALDTLPVYDQRESTGAG